MRVAGAKADGRVKALAEAIPKASNSKPFMVMSANLQSARRFDWLHVSSSGVHVEASPIEKHGLHQK